MMLRLRLIFFLSIFALSLSGQNEVELVEPEPPPPPNPRTVIKVFEEGDKKGIKRGDEIIVKAKYANIKIIHKKGYAKVKKKEKWRLLNFNSKKEIPKIKADDFKMVFRIKEYHSSTNQLVSSRYYSFPQNAALFQFKIGNKWGVVDENGKVLLDAEYDNLFKYRAVKNGKWGAVVLNNKIRIPFEYDRIERFNSDYTAVAIKDGLSGVIDTLGNPLHPFEFSKIGYLSRDYLKTTSSSKPELHGIIKKNGEMVLEPEFESIRVLNYAYLSLGKNGRVGLQLLNKTEILPIEYDRIDAISENLFLVERDGKHGLYDMNTFEAPILKYDVFIRERHSRKPFIVAQNNKWGLISSKGKILTPLEYQIIDKPDRGYYKVQKNGKWGFIRVSRRGKVNIACPIIYDELGKFAQGIIPYTKDGKKGNLVWSYKTGEIKESKVLTR